MLSVGSAKFSDDELRQWIVQHEGRGLSSRQLRFWEVVLDLPHDRVNGGWIQKDEDCGKEDAANELRRAHK